MSLCTDKNLKDLKKAYKKRRIFKIELSEDIFTLICEILKNLNEKKRFRRCLPKDLIKKKKKFDNFIDKIIDRKSDVEMRKNMFIELSKSSFKKWIFELIKSFYKRCLNVMNE